MISIVELAKQLIAKPSVTPRDEGCQTLIEKLLAPHGFNCQHLPFGDVQNLWAIHGTGQPVLVFAGHTDVVPPGPVDAWMFDPFTPTEYQGNLYGRGAVDMKSSLAAMVTALINFVKQYPNHPGSVALLLTSDEEGPSIDGTVKVVDYLQKKSQALTYCIVGEPSSSKTLGDVIKVGRRGSLNGELTIQGKQGHIAYPQLALNPIHACLNALEKLSTETWDEGHPQFPKTSFQLSNIHSGRGATNVIPDTLQATFNFRFSPAVTAEQLMMRTEAILKQHDLNFRIKWSLSGLPFITEQTELINAAKNAIQKICGISPQLSTDGGTSDGRFIAPTSCQVVEIGPINTTIHQINEHISTDDLDTLTQIYFQITKELL